MDAIADRVHRVTLTADVSGFKRSMSEAADATKKIGTSADETSQKGSSAFEKLSGVATKVLGAAAIAGAAKAILDVGLSYDKSLNSMQAVTSATGEEMAKVSELAKQLGNDINIPGASASDAAEAMTELAKGGLTLQESMAAAKGTLQLATAAQISGAEAATIQADALNAFNLEATEAGHVSDLLANAANAATGDIGDFAAGLAQSSAVANGLGISVDDTVTVLGLFANAGIKGSDAGTSFKTMLTQLQNPTDKAAGAMEELGITAFDAEGNFVGMRAITEQLAAAQANMSTQAFSSAAGIVFGSDAIRGATVIASGGVGAYDNMSVALSKVGGASQLAAAQAQGLPGAFANIQNQAESVALSLYEQVSPAFESILNSAAAALPGIGEFFGDVVTGAAGFVSFINGLPGPVKVAAAAFTAIAIIKNPVSDAFDTVGKKIESFKTKVEAAASSTTPLTQAVQPLVSSVGPLGEALEKSGTSASALGESLSDTASKAKSSQSALAAVDSAASPLAASLTAAGSSTDTLVSGLDQASSAADTTASAVDGAASSVSPLSEALSGGGADAEVLAEGLAAAAEKANESKGGIDGVSESVSPLSEALSGAGDASSSLVEGLSGAAGAAGDTAAAATEATDAADPLSGALEGAGLSADALGEGLGTASEKAKDVKTSGSGASGALTKIGAAGKVAGAGLLAAFGGPVGVSIAALTAIISQVGSAMSDLELPTNNFSGAVDELTGKVTALKAIEFISDTQVTALKDVGVSLADYSAALTGTPAQQKAVVDQINAYIIAQDGSSESVGIAMDLLKQLNGDLQGVAAAEEVAAEKARVLGEQNKAILAADLGAGMDAARTSAANAAPAIEDVSAALDATLRSSIEARPGQEQINKAWEDGSLDAGELSKQVGAVMQQMDLLAGRNGDAEAAQRAFNQSAIDYSSIILDQSLAGDQLAEANQKVADATAKRDEVQKNLNKSTEEGGTTQADLDRANRELTVSSTDLVRVQQDQKLGADRVSESEAGLREQMISAATAAAANAAATGNAAGAHTAASAAVQKAKDAFIALQPQADIASGKAQQVADALFGIPDDVATTVVANTLTADQQLQSIQGRINAINGSTATATVKVVQSIQVVGDAAVSAARSILNGAPKADGGMLEHGRDVQHAANGLSRMVKGGANLIHWAEPETVWESFISGKPSQRTRNQGIMSQTAAKLGGTYIPPGSTPQRFANGGLNEGAQRSFMGNSVVNNTRGGATYQISVTNTASRPMSVDELVATVRQAERSGRL